MKRTLFVILALVLIATAKPAFASYSYPWGRCPILRKYQSVLLVKINTGAAAYRIHQYGLMRYYLDWISINGRDKVLWTNRSTRIDSGNILITSVGSTTTVVDYNANIYKCKSTN